MVLLLYEKFSPTLSETNNEDSVCRLDISTYENQNKFIGVSK